MSSRVRAVALAVVLVAWPAVLERFPQRWRPLIGAGASTALAATVGTPLGLRHPQLGVGMRLGGVAASVVAVAVGASPALKPVRTSMRQRDIDLHPAVWLGLHIPVGTVWSEELAFRGVLQPMAVEAFDRALGVVVQAVAFGFAHIRPARAAGDSVPGTVLVTALFGGLLGWLRERSGSLASPVLAHLALNEAGAVAALCVARRNVDSRRESASN
ncbi:abortive phage infection protein [Mycobacteroides saopaulense]|uniref:Abortive phage infection protein n=1 Tax=Mycobacteroides saopaulense TaxID=1578165 RepID=A0A1S4VY66_9MYCO|nr:CPBP family intramembrane glutamic endopeptidase [Mycobacteroides saopaulense]ALR10616.1 abortive phage infection protein [Mycobacteroides saopaulense]ORB53428.1 abortive phage infection protein [Mycobacteroides saopaulense]